MKPEEERRDRVLSDRDIEALAKMLEDKHVCRFEGMSVEDMNFLKDLLLVYKETRSEFIKWLVKGIIYGTMILLVVFAYFKLHKGA